MQDSPLRSKFSKTSNPNLSALLIVTLCEHKQAPLLVVAFICPPRKESIKAFADLLRRALDGIFSIQRCSFFHNACEETHPRVVCTSNRLCQILKYEVFGVCVDAPPKSLTCPNV